MRSGPTLVLSALLTLGLPLLTGCDLPWADPEPDGAAERLASVIGEGSLDGVDLVDAPEESAAALEQVLAGMKGFEAEVAVGDIEVDGERAEATLRWTWLLAGTRWEYDAPAELVLDGETWRFRWDRSAVEPSLADDEVLDTTTLQARRGDILGAGDVPLVTLRAVTRFGIDRTKVDAAVAAASAPRLAELLGVDPATYAQRVTKAGPKAFVEAIVLREADAAPLRARVAAIPGAVGIGSERPLGPTKEFAAAILGTVGPATAEIVEKSEGEVRAGDLVGLSGLEARYDDALGGTPGVQVEAVGGEGADRLLHQVEQQDGDPLRTTLDPRLQALADRTLAGVVPASGLVALRPSTGEVLAAASGPGSKGYNSATFGRYPPGSTFKVVSALALLRSGLSPQSPVDCPEGIVVDGKRFKNYDDYPSSSLGTIPLREAIAQSCNTALIGAREKLGPDVLAGAAAALGLGVDHDLGFPAFFGEVPAPGSETGAAAAMIGQGTVLASPLAMASVIASVVSGKAVLPMLVTEHGVTAKQPAAPLTPAEAEALRAMLRGVVTEGSGRGLADVPGAPVLAKTGTAEFGTGADPQTHAWMIAAQGDLAVAVFVEVGESGSRTAGPLLEAFLRGAGS